MEKTKFLTISVVALLLINLGTLGFLLFAPNPGIGTHGMHREPKFVIIDRLDFDKAQVEKYENLIAWHRGEIGGIEKRMHDTKNKLYLQLSKNDVDIKYKDSLIGALAVYQSQIEETHFTHFQDIKKICRPEQLDRYYKLTGDLSRIFSKTRNPKPE